MRSEAPGRDTSLRVHDAASPLAGFTPSEVVLLFPVCVSLSLPDAFLGSFPALVSGRHVDATNVTPRLVHCALGALVSHGDVTLSLHVRMSRIFGLRETSVVMTAGSPERRDCAGAREGNRLVRQSVVTAPRPNRSPSLAAVDATRLRSR